MTEICKLLESRQPSQGGECVTTMYYYVIVHDFYIMLMSRHVLRFWPAAIIFEAWKSYTVSLCEGSEHLEKVVEVTVCL